ncbi:hypothetical protein VTK73DRAFT_7124 [Phialemonium thermophilum]|uniref:Ubiquitin 3 binding protein But2 C-terminal domain-containing protein n=1 Tax=Phialemonium thermophilum TaxID=223376 RepID=A0ABR3WGD5_9PEZI
MYFASLVLTLAAVLLTTTTANPIISNLEVHPEHKRSCISVFPAPLPQQITIARTPAGVSQPVSLTFGTIPSSGWGPCSLVVSLPSGYPLQQQGNTQLNVYATNGPAAGSLVGTTTLVADGAVHTINSFSCRPSLGFRFEIAGTAAGSVSFTELQGVGFYVTYSC